MKVYAVRVEDICEAELEKIIGKITKDRREVVDRFIFKKDKIRSIISEVLLKTILFKEFGMNNSDIVIRKSEYGKPYLEGREDLNFNISHSGDFVVCAVDNKAIGIDIEQILDVDYKSIVESFFSKEDIELISNCSDEERIDRFYEIWTLKESYVKAKGKGLSIPLNSFGFKLYDDNKVLNINDNKYSFKQFNVFQGYKMSICSLNYEIVDEVIEVNQRELICEYYELI